MQTWSVSYPSGPAFTMTMPLTKKELDTKSVEYRRGYHSGTFDTEVVLVRWRDRIRRKQRRVISSEIEFALINVTKAIGLVRALRRKVAKMSEFEDRDD